MNKMTNFLSMILFTISLMISSCTNKSSQEPKDYFVFKETIKEESQIIGKSKIKIKSGIKNRERTFGMIKPLSASSESEVRQIEAMIKNYGLDIVASKKITMNEREFNLLYGVHSKKYFFDSLKNSMLNKEVIIMIIEGQNAVERYRDLMGKYVEKDEKENLQDKNFVTIRELFARSQTENAVHGSDSSENATREICIFFLNECSSLKYKKEFQFNPQKAKQKEIKKSSEKISKEIVKKENIDNLKKQVKNQKEEVKAQKNKIKKKTKSTQTLKKTNNKKHTTKTIKSKMKK